MEHQLSVAMAGSERFDRPLVRHLHRAEVESARTQLGWLPDAVNRQRAKVDDLERQVDSSKSRSLADRLDDGRQKRLEAELAELRSQLTDDAHARGRALVENVPDVVLHRLGPPPSRAETREAWIEAAGRMAQHQAAWDIPEDHLLGRKPQMFHDDAYELTRQEVAKSMSTLDRSVGRPLEREVPGRGLSR